MRLTLRQLQVFITVARTENISQAAQALSMSQSAASSALKDLEQRHNVLLFDRIGKRLQLNEQGRLIRPRAEALVARAEDLDQLLTGHQAAGAIKVGATLTIGNYLAVGMMATMKKAYADGEVSLEVANTATIVRKVLDYSLDIGLIEGEYHHPDLDMTPWLEDDLVVFARPDHPLLNRQPLTDEALLDAEWILREPGSGTRQIFEQAMRGIMPELNIILSLQHTEAIKRAVEAGLGIGCLSGLTLADAFQRGTLAPLQVAKRDFHRRFYIVLHKQKYHSTGLQRWMALCQRMQAASAAGS